MRMKLVMTGCAVLAAGVTCSCSQAGLVAGDGLGHRPPFRITSFVLTETGLLRLIDRSGTAK